MGLPLQAEWLWTFSQCIVHFTTSLSLVFYCFWLQFKKLVENQLHTSISRLDFLAHGNRSLLLDWKPKVCFTDPLIHYCYWTASEIVLEAVINYGFQTDQLPYVEDITTKCRMYRNWLTTLLYGFMVTTIALAIALWVNLLNSELRLWTDCFHAVGLCLCSCLLWLLAVF